MHLAKDDDVSIEEMQGRLNIAAVDVGVVPPSLYLANKIGGIDERTNGLNEENRKLRGKIKALKKKVEEMEGQNQEQGETIRILEASYDKLQKELVKVKKEKDQLRIEIEEKTSTFSTENKILAERLEALTTDFEEVEKENNELKRRLDQLTNSNNSLKQTVDLVKKENQELKEEMGNLKDKMVNLKADHKELREKLERKETRLALGQVAWLLEAEIWKAVLPDEKMGTIGILKSMKHWLRKNSSNDEGKEAQKRWDDLKDKLNWDEDDHKLALSVLKKLRVDDAHPAKVDLEQARKQLNEGGYIADTDKKSCEEIIDMLVTARNLNNSK